MNAAMSEFAKNRTAFERNESVVDSVHIDEVIALAYKQIIDGDANSAEIGNMLVSSIKDYLDEWVNEEGYEVEKRLDDKERECTQGGGFY